ncbi:hypothetical protein D3C85_1028950 [compost metagenome]
MNKIEPLFTFPCEGEQYGDVGSAVYTTGVGAVIITAGTGYEHPFESYTTNV